MNTYIQLGKITEGNEVLLSAFQKCIGNIFFYNLRTLQQLGYIVSASPMTADTILYYRIIVQGSKKDPRSIDQAINEVFNIATEKVNDCASRFENVKSSIKEKILKNDENIKERGLRIWTEIDLNRYAFNRTNTLLEEVDNLTPAKLQTFYKNNILGNNRRLTIHHYAGNTDIPDSNGYTSDLNITKSLKFIRATTHYINRKVNPTKMRRQAMRSNNFINKIK